MRLFKLTILSMVLLIVVACGGWGGYVHKSDHFGYRIPFPVEWEVWDRSNDVSDNLLGTIPSEPNAEIQVLAVKVALDINPHGVYMIFLEGGQDTFLYDQFRVSNQGTIHAKNAEGRSIEVQYINKGQSYRGIRAMFLGTGFTIEIKASAPAEKFSLFKPVFKKMIGHLNIYKS